MSIFSKLFKPQKTLIGTIPAAAGIKPGEIVATMSHGKGLIALTTQQHASGSGHLAIATFTTPGAFVRGQWHFGESDGKCYIEWPPLPGDNQEMTQVTAVNEFTFSPEFLPEGFEQTPNVQKKMKQPDSMEEGFRLLHRLVEDEDYQNSLLEEPIAEKITTGEAVDVIATGTGPFGFSAKNPIPVNGALGEVSYLSRLRNRRGERLFFHRLGAIDLIDVYEAVSWSGMDWYLFYLDLYHPRRSRKAPEGFTFSADLGQFTGFSVACADFPKDFAAQRINCPFSLGYISTETASKALKDGTFVRPVAHEAALRSGWIGDSAKNSNAKIGDPPLTGSGGEGYGAGNETERARAYLDAAKNGDAQAQFKLGSMYDDMTEEEAVDHGAKSVKWFRLASEQGHAEAQWNLYFFYNCGVHVPEDTAEALKWCRRAADGGSAYAQDALARHYQDADGVPRDFVEAYKWRALYIAQMAPNARAPEQIKLDSLAAQMSEDQVREARA